MLPGRRQRKRKDRTYTEETNTTQIPWETIKKYSITLSISISIMLAFYYAINADD